jgi:hypothetical protein
MAEFKISAWMLAGVNPSLDIDIVTAARAAAMEVAAQQHGTGALRRPVLVQTTSPHILVPPPAHAGPMPPPLPPPPPPPPPSHGVQRVRPRPPAAQYNVWMCM